MTPLITFILALLRLLVPALIEKSTDTAEESKHSRIADQLQRQIRLALKGAAIVALLVCCGCFTRTIYVPHGEPVRLRETVKAAKIWVLDSQGKPVASEMDLPEGWYCLPLKDENEKPQ